MFEACSTSSSQAAEQPAERPQDQHADQLVDRHVHHPAEQRGDHRTGQHEEQHAGQYVDLRTKSAVLADLRMPSFGMALASIWPKATKAIRRCSNESAQHRGRTSQRESLASLAMPTSTPPLAELGAASNNLAQDPERRPRAQGAQPAKIGTLATPGARSDNRTESSAASAAPTRPSGERDNAATTIRR